MSGHCKLKSVPLKHEIPSTGNFGAIVKRDGSRWRRPTSTKRGYQIS